MLFTVTTRPEPLQHMLPCSQEIIAGTVRMTLMLMAMPVMPVTVATSRHGGVHKAAAVARRK